MFLALVLNPKVLRGLWYKPANIAALREALSNLGMNHAVSMIISTNPDNFMHAGLIQALKTKSLETSTIMAEIISKCVMLVPPGEALHELEEVLG